MKKYVALAVLTATLSVAPQSNAGVRFDALLEHHEWETLGSATGVGTLKEWLMNNPVALRRLYYVMVLRSLKDKTTPVESSAISQEEFDQLKSKLPAAKQSSTTSADDISDESLENQE
jgi:hypothetical protein